MTASASSPAARRPRHRRDRSPPRRRSRRSAPHPRCAPLDFDGRRRRHPARDASRRRARRGAARGWKARRARAPRGRAVRRVHRRRHAAAALSPALSLRRRRDVGARRSLSLFADRRRGRSASLQRGDASRALERARRAPARDRRRARRLVRGVGAECAQRRGGRAARAVGWAPAPDAAPRIVGGVRALRPRCRAGHDVQVSAPHARGDSAHQDRSVRLRDGGAAGDRVVRRRSHALRVEGRRMDGWAPDARQHQAADAHLRAPPRLVGARSPKTTIGRSPIASSRRASSSTASDSASRTSS